MSSEKIIEDLGENYQYLKTIAENKIEIFKLQFYQKMYASLGKIILSATFFISAFFLLEGLLIAFSIYIGNILNSLILGFLIGFSTLIPINIIIYLLREYLIYRPLAHLVHKKLKIDEE